MLAINNYPFEVLTADFAVIGFLVAVAIAVWLALRAIDRAGMRRLEHGGAGMETVQDRKRKKEERAARKARAEASEDASETKQAKGRSKKGKKGRKGKKTRREAPRADASEPTDSEEPVDKAAPKADEPPASGLLLPEGKSLGEGLSKTRERGFVGRLSKLFKGRDIDEGLLDQIEEVLFTADIGVRTSNKLLAGMRSQLAGKDLQDSSKIWKYLRSEAASILEGAGAPDSLKLSEKREGPHVVLVVGVNGSGKTTSIGKLAHRMVAEGKTVLVGAGDTYRAAAGEQLEIWAKRVGATFVHGASGADPSSVLFDAVQRGARDGVDVILLDTAGRLHTNANLVKELKKVNRTIGKALPGAPHEVLLVLDGTQGQNTIAQAHSFSEALGVTGFVLTKLDGTAKGGVILGICDELKLPLCWIGVGERTEDLRPFEPADFVDALFKGAEAA